MFIDKIHQKNKPIEPNIQMTSKNKGQRHFIISLQKVIHSYNNQIKRYIVSLLPYIVLRDSTFNNYYATSGGFTFHVPADCGHEVLLV
jgi:hypothetical protein